MNIAISNDKFTDVVSGLNIYPNPFSDNIQFDFDLKNTEKVSILVQDITGKTITTIFDGKLNAGTQKIEWKKGNEIPAGIYFARIQVGNIIKTQKLVHLNK